MTRTEATTFLRNELDQHGLTDWSIRLTINPNSGFLGLCSYKDKCIILNAHHIDLHPNEEIINTIRHEIAHAIVGPNNGHNEIWRQKAKQIGCDNTNACSTLTLPPQVIDAIRSGAEIEMIVEEEVVRKVSHRIVRLQDRCPECGEVAEELFSIESVDNDGNDCKLITLKCYHIIKKIIPKATPFQDFITYEHRNNGCEHEWDKNHCVKCDAYRLFEFQVEGAQFLERSLAVNRGAALFDEMGLGKTVQPLAYLHYHKEAAPVLFIVKSSVKYQFFKEIIRWLGPEWIAQVISTSKDPILPGLKCYIISYDLLRRYDIKKIEATGIKTVILDECQQIKNPDSTRTGEVRKVVKLAEKVIPLSGTPWKNRGSEFFVVLNMLDPRRFYSYASFIDRWVDKYFEGAKPKEGGIRKPKEFKEFIQDIALRRERIEVMKELPLINRVRYYTEIDSLSQSQYDDAVSDFVRWYNNAVIGGEEDEAASSTNMLAKLARMRHITGLAKIPATVELVKEYFEGNNGKVVVFVHHKDVGEIMKTEMQKAFPLIKILSLTSDKNSIERFNLQEEFNKTNKIIMIASTLAAGEGLNLQTCDYCIMHERQWNPANEEQAEGRFIRIGQTSKSVTGQYTTAAGTVDEHLDKIVEKKRIAFHNAMNKGEMPVWRENDIIKEVAESIVDDYNKKNKKSIKKLASLGA